MFDAEIGRGSPAGLSFLGPFGVHIDRERRLVVVDDLAHAAFLIILGPGWTPDAEIRRWRVLGGPGQFNGPLGLAVDSAALLFVADSGNRRVQVLNLEGQAVAAVTGGPDSALERPVDVAVSTERLYVSDAGRHSVQRFRR